ncbi:Lactose permease [Lachnellula suecica]|uniref:Lactose permease n=1 Tax=Lachnellula suecica TaxID=602035 RepID=A0A8T9CH70_9HELO|nr:Lactose permease [Lachnellula suecica]
MDNPKFNLVPKSSRLISILLVAASCVTSSETLGFDGSMMNGLNILPSYTDFFHLNTTTLALNTASVWLGGCIAGFFYGLVTDAIGRKNSLLLAAIITILGVILQTASQNVAMFVVSRIIIGFGTAGSGSAGPTYLAETLPFEWRAWGLGVFYDFWYVGGLIASGVTYGTAKMDSTWAWRIPSALQGLFSVVCILLLPFIPESPRWLVHKGRHEEALEVVALTYADGDQQNPVVLAQYKQIIDTLKYEVENGETLGLMQTVKTPSSRKRLLLAISVAIITMLSGNNIISYYLGTMLDNAGITDTTTQLEINIILNAWCLTIALIGTYLVDKMGRKLVAVCSTIFLIIFLFMFGGLTAAYGTSTNTAGIYGTVAALFLFQGSYSFGWTPLTVLYPPEVLNFPIRANGMAIYNFFTNAVGLLVTFAFPYALATIEWKIYMINGAWDVLELAFVLYFWVETKGKTLEEIDELFDGVKHSDVPDLEAILNGKVDVSDLIVESVEVTDKAQAKVGVKGAKDDAE